MNLVFIVLFSFNFFQIFSHELNELDIVVPKRILYITCDPECPISQKYTSLFKTIGDLYPSLQFSLLFSPSTTKSSIIQFYKNYDLKVDRILYIRDHRMKLIKKLGATITPEAFLIDDSKIFYYGAMDDRYYELGKMKSIPTQHFLLDAIDAMLRQKVIKTSHIQAVGCVIEL